MPDVHRRRFVLKNSDTEPGMIRSWRLSDENDVVHLVTKATPEEVETYRRMNYHRIYHTGRGDPYIVYEPPAEKGKQVLTVCLRWLWIHPPHKEQRQANCLGCLSG